MKKLVFIFTILFFSNSFLHAQTATLPSGSGTQGDPYQIETLDNLFWVTQNQSSWSSTFIQTADIDASSTSGWDSGAGFTPIGNGSTNYFTGSYNGKGHTITGLYINRPTTDYVGLFGLANGTGSLDSLGVKDVNITGKKFVGGLVGLNNSSTRSVSNTFTTGTVTGKSGTAGGLVGSNGGTIINSYSACSVIGNSPIVGGLVGFNASTGSISKSFSTGNANGTSSHVGGLVGQNSGSITNTYSTGSATGTYYAGGLVGINIFSGTINYSFAKGNVPGNDPDIGGLVGNNSGTVSNSFWDTETTGRASSSGGSGKTTAEMKTQSTFTDAGWDFTVETTNGTNDIWEMNGTDNSGYPLFTWWEKIVSVTTVSPAKNALAVLTNSDIEVTFDGSINSLSANLNTIKIYGSLKGAYSATFSYQNELKKLTINPNENFAAGEVITVVLTTGVKNVNNWSLANSFTSSFTVKSQTAGSFSSKTDYPVSSNPYFIQSDDVDGDGDQDIITSNWVSKEVSVLLNNGDGTLGSETSFNLNGQPNNFISADLDGNGYNDFVSANTDSLTVEVLLSNGNGTLADLVRYPIGEGLWTLTSGDVDGDGDIDLITGNSNNNTLSVLLNNGDGTFAEKMNHTTNNNTTYISSGDVDGDGDLDLVTVNYYDENVTVFLNDGSGVFDAGTDYTLGLQSGFITTADLDHDGDLDIVTSSSDYISVMKNNGSGVFGSPENNSAHNSWNVQPADIDGDGDLDLLSINYSDNKFSILSNNGNGTFAANTEYAAANTPAWINTVDLNGDGTLDIVIANDTSNTISVYKGAVPSATDPTSGAVKDAIYFTPLTLTGNLDITGTLTITAQVTTGNNTIDLGTTGSITGETNGTYTIGKVQATRTISSSQSNIAGLGISIDPQSNNLGSTIIKRETGTAAQNQGIKQVWTITPETQPSGPVTVTLSWPSTNDNSINLNDLVVYKSGDGGDTWNVISATINKDSDPRTATFTISSFSVFTIGNSSFPLPVELSSFTASVSGDGVKLNWSTATETTNSGWEVEQRLTVTGETGVFRKVGFIAGKGTTTEAQTYSFNVTAVKANLAEFRLKQIDMDGKSTYSQILSVEVKPAAFELSQNYPNPFNPATTIRYSIAAESKVSLTLYNALGQKVKTLVQESQPAGFYSVQLNASDLSSGMYFYVLETGSFKSVKKLTLLK